MGSSFRREPLLLILLLPFLIYLASVFAAASARHPRSCSGHRTAFSSGDSSHDISSLSLLRDAHVDRDAGLQVSGSQPHRVGGVFHSLAVRFLSPFGPPYSLSFSSIFSFSMDSKEGGGLALVIVPRKVFKGFSRPRVPLSPSTGSSEFRPLDNTVAIEFGASVNEGVKDRNGNDVGLAVETLEPLATANVSDGVSLNDGRRLFPWIDYRAVVKIVEVRSINSESVRDVWRIVVALLFGATSATAFFAGLLLFSAFIRRRSLSGDEDFEAGIMHEYQKATCPLSKS